MFKDWGINLSSIHDYLVQAPTRDFYLTFEEACTSYTHVLEKTCLVHEIDSQHIFKTSLIHDLL